MDTNKNNGAPQEDLQPAVPCTDTQFDHGDRRYEITLAKFNHKGNAYTAKEAAAEPSIHAALVAMAWESNEANTPRDEADFDSCGFLKLVY